MTVIPIISAATDPHTIWINDYLQGGDDTLNLLSAIADAQSQGKSLRSNVATATITGTIDINWHCDLSLLTLNVNGSSVSPAIRVGGTNSLTYALQKTISLPNIINTAKTTVGWSGFGVGVELANCDWCNIIVNQIHGFGIGLDCGGYGEGFSYNQVSAVYLANNKINFRGQAKDSSGWITSNNFYISRMWHDSAEGSNVSGTRMIQVIPNDYTSTTNPWPDTNIFYGGTVEGNTAEYMVECSGRFNKFNDLRYEGSSPKVLIKGHSSNTNATRDIIFDAGYHLDNVIFTKTGQVANCLKRLPAGDSAI